MPRVVDEVELAAWGRCFGGALPAGSVVWLEGDLGAGKTTLVKSLVAGLGAGDSVTSPTYALIHRYDGARGPVFHVDCYRLRNPEEARDLDWEGLGRGDALLIEWPARAGAWAARPTHVIRLAHEVDPSRRRIEVETR